MAARGRLSGLGFCGRALSGPGGRERPAALALEEELREPWAYLDFGQDFGYEGLACVVDVGPN